MNIHEVRLMGSDRLQSRQARSNPMWREFCETNTLLPLYIALKITA